MNGFKEKFPKLHRKLLVIRYHSLQFVLGHFKVVWYVLLNTPFIKKYSIEFLFNLLGSGADFPFPYRTKYPFVSVDAIEDYSYHSRMLPEKPRPADYQYPPVDEVVEDLFLRKKKSTPSQQTDRHSSLLFGGFAQWFAAGFLMMDPNDCRRSGLFPTSVANVNTVYGNDPGSQKLLRSMKGGKLKSQVIKGQEYPLFLRDIPELIHTPLFQAFLQRPGTKSVLQHSSQQGMDIDTLFAFGQIQINATPGAIAWGIIFLREHNQICDELQKLYPAWDDEQLYHTARNICTLILNKIVLRDYISIHNAHHLAMDIPFTPEYLRGQKWSFGIANSLPIEWNHLYRFHSFTPDTVIFDGKEVPLASTFYNPGFVTEHGLDKIVDQLSKSPICPFGPQNTPYFLTQIDKQTIEEGRQVNLATYNDYREEMGLPRALKFSDINPNQSVIDALHKHYKNVDDVEWYVGMIAEEVQKDRLFPTLLARMLSSVAFSVIMLQPWLAASIWSRRDEMLTPFGSKRLDDTTIQTMIHRHVSKETYVSFFLPKDAQ